MDEVSPDCYRVGVKLTDLMLWEVPKPCHTSRGELQIVNMSTDRGSDPECLGNVWITFWLGTRACWQMKSQVGCPPDVAEVYQDEFWPMGT